MKTHATSIATLIENFAAQIRAVLREEVEAEVLAQITKGFQAPPRTSTLVAQRTVRRAPNKRTPEEITKQGARILAHVTAHPNVTAEMIAAELKVPTSDLSLPVKRLLAEKKLAAKGKARGTRYSAK